MTKAVFLDRDGVLNALILNPKTAAYESPLTENDLRIAPNVFKLLRRLNEADFLLFVVSNQPNYAKAKSSLETLHRIDQVFAQQMTVEGVKIEERFYCYHHPQGVIPGYSGECPCRKPKPYFLLEAQKKYGIDMKLSWMVGDQDSDIFCGKAAGVKTVLINEPHSQERRGNSKPDYFVQDLAEAVHVILEVN